MSQEDIINDFFDDKQQQDEIIIGIDLGTSNSCCSYWDNDHYVMIPDEVGNILFSSIISFDSNDNMYTCNIAVKHINGNNFFYETKRLIGRKYSDEFIQQEKQYLTYDIIDNNDKINIVKYINNTKHVLTPEEVAGYILHSIKSSAELFLNRIITKCVITVPAYFTESQKLATKNAAVIAGLDCKMIICEPVASAYAYGIINKYDYTILVYDFGGGTLDVSLVRIKDNVFEILETGGNMHLGGIDFDKVIYNYCLDIFKLNNHLNDVDIVDINKKKELMTKSEIAKKMLSNNDITKIYIKDFYNNNDLDITLTREKFEELSNELLLLSLQPINKIFTNSLYQKEKVDEIIMVGGTSRIPSIQNAIKMYFGKQPNLAINPDYIVAIGAGIQAYMLSHPLSDISQSVVLLNNTTLSIGVEVSNEIMDVLIPRNTIIPTQISRIYTNMTDDPQIKIRLFEGERPLTKDNSLIGELYIDVEPKPPGSHKIKVIVDINIENLLTFKAIDLLDNTTKELVINTKNNQLNQDELKRILDDADKYKLMDKMNKKVIKSKIYLSSLIDNILSNKKTLLNIIPDFDFNNIDDIKNNIEIYNFTDINECIQLLEPIATMVITNDKQIELSGYSGDIATLISGNSLEIIKNGTSVYQDNKLNDTEVSNDNNITKQSNDKLLEELNKLEQLCNDINDKLGDDDNDDVKDILNYVDNTLLYIHITESLEYDKIHNIYVDLMDRYNKIIKKYYVCHAR